MKLSTLQHLLQAMDGGDAEMHREQVRPGPALVEPPIQRVGDADRTHRQRRGCWSNRTKRSRRTE